MKFLRMQCHALENVTPSLYKVTPYISVTSCIYIYIYLQQRSNFIFCFAISISSKIMLSLLLWHEGQVLWYEFQF